MSAKLQGPELRARLKSKLLGLEDKDVREQIDRELQKVFPTLHGPQQVDQGLKELFNNLDSCNPVARKLRYRWELSLLMLNGALLTSLLLLEGLRSCAIKSYPNPLCLHCRLVAVTLSSHSFETFADSCPFLTRQLVQRASIEDQPPLVTELAGAVFPSLRWLLTSIVSIEPR